ncbi:putative secreted protein [Wickerhamomyces ciferrii]|uniref:Secreted protein n=1 Tax=Wickerhamomyces ciferrii (strain ATCC 14091 / BCRC 22168 / CBS 111 / JCM 3599 / NBRC 0793 / NRRL Y-1031 F-60-10) TaxID=1206466 RepID=K0KEX8_WICCF|nr:uncharacterized protein BN7_3244 [Wickerhamomyces ciferrii]CCH43690.1 putative secreted protein [Wickerhamomyces ciferrii]
MLKPIRLSRFHKFLSLSSLFQYQSGSLLASNFLNKKFHSSSLRYQKADDALAKAKNALNYQFYTAGNFIPALEMEHYNGNYRVYPNEDYYYNKTFTCNKYRYSNKRYSELVKYTDTREEIHLVFDIEDIIKYACDSHELSANYNGKGLQMEDKSEEDYYRACLIVFNDADGPNGALTFDLKFYASHYLWNEKPRVRYQRMEIDSISHHEKYFLDIESHMENYVGTIKKDDKISPIYEKELFEEHKFKKECFIKNKNSGKHGNCYTIPYKHGRDVAWWKKYEKPLKLREEKRKAHNKTFQSYRMQKFDRLDKNTQKAFHDYVSNHLKIKEPIFEKTFDDALLRRIQYFKKLEKFTNNHTCEKSFNNYIDDFDYEYAEFDDEEIDGLSEDCQACKDFETLKENEKRDIYIPIDIDYIVERP